MNVFIVVTMCSMLPCLLSTFQLIILGFDIALLNVNFDKHILIAYLSSSYFHE